MKYSEVDVVIDGRRLRRSRFEPDDPGTIRAAAVHYHGQGDYTARYEETMEHVTRQGVAVIGTDLPGHGKSDGRRGVVPGLPFVDRMAGDNLRHCRKRWPGVPVGITGHSAGGLLALRELLRNPEPYAFSWISSPLLYPDANQNRLLLLLLPLAASLLPNFTVSTRVTAEQCLHNEARAAKVAEGAEVFFHQRVSLAWGRAMIEAAGFVRGALLTRPPEVPFLITQGTEDQVCPVGLLRPLLERCSIPALRYVEIPDALHEPFADTQRKQVFTALADWLHATLPTLPVRAAAS
jgi:alpha-beta hydrolase superfamily lysophospholipase